MAEINPYQSPQVATVARASSDASPGTAAWRSGPLLVVGENSVLEDRCVKCNEPTDGYRRKIKLVWYPSYVYIGLLVGFFLFLLLVLIAQKKITIQAGVCPMHLAKRRRAMVLCTLGFVLGTLLFIGAFVVAREVNVVLLLIAIATLLASAIYGATATRLLWPQRIKNKQGWIKGACPEFLAALPEYPGM